MLEFKDLCAFLEEIKQTKVLAEKQKLVKEEFKKIREILGNDSHNFFQILRLLLPKLDRERDSYNMKEAKVARTFIKMLDLPPGADRDVLNKSYLMAAHATDFGDVVHSVIRKYLSNRITTLTIAELNGFLDELTKRKSEFEAETIMMKIFKKASSGHIRWIVRIILKDLKLGISANTVMNCYHRDAASFYASNNNLRKVSEVLANEDIKLHELEIEIFEPFRPMLSKRIDASNFKKELPNNKSFYLENKFDGERFQLHMKNNEFRFFSRNGFDYTDHPEYGFGKSYDTGILCPGSGHVPEHKTEEGPRCSIRMYGVDYVKIIPYLNFFNMSIWLFRDTTYSLKPYLVFLGIFTPKLKGVFNGSVNNVILDGEMMLWNKNTKKYGSKGMTLDVKKLKDRGPYQPCFCVYDIILLNNRILTNVPLKQRVHILKEVLNNFKEGTMILSRVKEVSSQQEIVDELNYAVNTEEEGIIIKDPDSIYKYSDRTGGWYKMKLEFFQDVMNDLDLIVMGGTYASSTSDRLNSFIVGISSGIGENGKPVYLSLGKVSSGLSDDDLDELNIKLKSKGKKFEEFDCKNLLFGKEKPNFYIAPENSLVFQIRASELVRSADSSFKTAYTLRFPRVLKMRTDKPVDECLSINELLELTKNNKSVIKLNKRNIELNEILKSKAKKPKREISMPVIYDTKRELDLLENYNIFVLNGSNDLDKEKAESFIKKASGKVSYRAKEEVDIILVGEHSERVKELIKKREKFDIINLSWLQRVIQDGNVLDYEQDEVYYLGNSYKNCLSNGLDMFGDSYTVETTSERLKKTFKVISEMGLYSHQNNMIEPERLHHNFSNLWAYFDKHQNPEDKNSTNIYVSFLDEIEFKYYNGNVCHSISNIVNLIVYNGDQTRKLELDNYLKEIHRNDIEIQTKEFIYQ